MPAKSKSKRRKRNAATQRGRKSGRRSKKRVAEHPIVGIGGSAGGYEATSQLLRQLPAKTGMTFVVVQHLDPHHLSRLASLLGKVTRMPVIELKGKTYPAADTVYVQPPNKCVVMEDSSLALVERTRTVNVGIDQFFESLAEHRGARAIGVLLSGTGSDGTAGLRAIKVAGGISFAQDEGSAKFADMPRNAVRAGFVDAVMTPEDIARELRRITAHPYLRLVSGDGEEMPQRNADGEALERIFVSLRKHMGVDFSSYKPGTLRRRMERRIAVHRLRTLKQYARFLRDNKREIRALFDDLLINVTRFFRDPSLFRVLQNRFLPTLLKKNPDRQSLRVWIPGCATGEEVYSLAICILEKFRGRASKMRIQIFGTDLSEAMIDHARAGVYPNVIKKDVSAERLRRFFIKRDSSYQIAPHVRDLCTFARQNVVTDPPFSRLDLISCRNVLIYLGADLHKRCIPQFHHALNPGGYLVLGPAESIGVFEELFELVDKKHKIYGKKTVPTPRLELDVFGESHLGNLHRRPIGQEPIPTGQLGQVADRIVLSAYAPAAVVIDYDMQVHQFRGRTESFLEHAPGPASLNILHLARPTLVPDLRTLIRRAIKTNKAVRKERSLMKFGGKTREINIQVVPFRVPISTRKWLLIIFDETTRGTKPGKLPKILGKTASQREIGELRRDLAASKESLQAIIEEQEATNEELKAANEEIESSNEELQSTNEELETTKEELQSSNEELTTLNEDLSNRNLEMGEVNNELNSLLDSIQLPIVMVDNDLKVHRATSSARTAFNILPTDVGRPIGDFRPNIDVPNLEEVVREVIESLTSRERNVIDKNGRQYFLRIRPYRSTENKIEGAVITLVEIDQKKGRKDRA